MIDHCTEGFKSWAPLNGNFYEKSVIVSFESVTFCFRLVYFVFNTSRCVGMEVDDHTLSGKTIWKKKYFFMTKKVFFNLKKNLEKQSTFLKFQKISKFWFFFVWKFFDFSKTFRKKFKFSKFQNFKIPKIPNFENSRLATVLGFRR